MEISPRNSGVGGEHHDVDLLEITDISEMHVNYFFGRASFDRVYLPFLQDTIWTILLSIVKPLK